MLPNLISYYIRHILFVPPKTKAINFPMLQRLGFEMTVGKHFATIEPEFLRRLLSPELVFYRNNWLDAPA